MKRIIFPVFLGCIVCMYANAQDRPEWVDTPSGVYPERLYVSAVGSGQDRRRAEVGALASLASYFKQSITNRININDTEREVDGRSLSESQSSQSIEAASALDTLIGAEIKNTWQDPKNNNWYAVVVMEKAKGRGLYSAELDKAIREVNGLIDTSGGISFETLSNCQKAQGILGKADVYALILSMLDGPDRQSEISRLTAEVTGTLIEARAMPVDVRVRGDVNGRIRAAFAEAFTARGFRMGNTNSRFALEVTMNLSPVTQGRSFNTRYTVDAVLKDTRTGAELLTYNAANRVSHPANQTEADNRAVIGAERKITEEFPEMLQNYLGP